MLFGMVGSRHLYIEDAGGLGLWLCLGLIVLLELNALFGKLGPIASVKGVIHSSVGLTALVWAILYFL